MTINVTEVEPLKALRIQTENGLYIRLWVEGESGTTYQWLRESERITIANVRVWEPLQEEDGNKLDIEMALPVSKYTVEHAQTTLSDAAALRIELALLTESFNSLMENKQ